MLELSPAAFGREAGHVLSGPPARGGVNKHGQTAIHTRIHPYGQFRVITSACLRTEGEASEMPPTNSPIGVKSQGTKQLPDQTHRHPWAGVWG